MSDAGNLPGGQPPPKPGGGNPVVAPPPQNAGAGGTAKVLLDLESVKYLSHKLEQAELLLGYAAEVGIEVKEATRNDVLKARAESAGGKMTEETAADLLTALTTLAANVRPVTVSSLKFCVDDAAAYEKETEKTIRYYLILVVLCAFPIVICSLLTFVFNHFAEKIKDEIKTANDLAVKLQAELGPGTTNDVPATNALETEKLSDDQIWWGATTPPRGLDNKDVFHDLQDFAVAMREIDEYAGLLNHMLPKSQPDPFSQTRTNREAMREKLEFKPGFMIRLSNEFAKKFLVYQHVRAFGESVQENGSVFYGAFATYILPILYALLGASAYLLRLYEDQIKNRSYVGGGRNPAHLVVAGIGGMVVGLFNNVTQGVGIGPFAEAFLVGYAVDVFFTFLEGLLQMFKRNPSGPAKTN